MQFFIGTISGFHTATLEVAKMDYGALLRRAWEIVWNNKFLIVLGIIIALSSSGSTGNSVNQLAEYQTDGDESEPNFDDFEPFEGIEPPSQSDLEEIAPFLGLGLAILLPLLCVAMVAGLVIWALGQVAQGGLIAGADVLDAGGVSTFSLAWRAGWEKGLRLIGIGLLPAVPGIALLAVLLGSGGAMFGIAGLEERAALSAGGGLIFLVVVLSCVLGLISLVLTLLASFAYRACMLEGLGVFDSYARGFEVLRQHLGPAIVVFLIQVGIGLGLGALLLVPTVCCILWPLVIVANGGITAFFSTVWTLAWREWTGRKGRVGEPVIEPGPAV
jgi:hypothetical protein